MDEVRIMPREEIRRRLVQMRCEPHVSHPNEITRRDVANWLGVSFTHVRRHESGFWPITEGMQLAYSQFFSLLDAGCLKVDPSSKKKQLVRVPPPPEPPKKALRPHVDFVGPMLKLRFDP